MAFADAETGYLAGQPLGRLATSGRAGTAARRWAGLRAGTARAATWALVWWKGKGAGWSGPLLLVRSRFEPGPAPL